MTGGSQAMARVGWSRTGPRALACPAGPPLWSSGDVTARTLYARGPNATATEGNRRVALLALVDELSDRLAEHFLESPELPK